MADKQSLVELVSTRIEVLFSAFLKAVAVACYMGAPAIALLLWGWQSLTYLKSGEWPSRSALNVLIETLGRDAFGGWVVWPTSWFGFHRVLEVIPAALFIIGIGWLVALIAYAWHIGMEAK